MVLALGRAGGWLPAAVRGLACRRRAALVTLLVLVGVGLAAGHAGLPRLRALPRRQPRPRVALSRPAGHRRRCVLGDGRTATAWCPAPPARRALPADPAAGLSASLGSAAALRRRRAGRPAGRPGGAPAVPRPAGALAPADGSLRHVPDQRRAALRRRAAASCGYWGVARDITDVDAARAALAATETRYQELFARIPTPLVLHRAAASSTPTRRRWRCSATRTWRRMLGSDLAGRPTRAATRASARAAASSSCSEQPPGTALPVADFRLRGARAPQCRCAPPACAWTPRTARRLLSIFVDDTERLAAERRCAAPRPCCRTWWPPAPT